MVVYSKSRTCESRACGEDEWGTGCMTTTGATRLHGVLELLKVWTTWLSSFSEWGYQYVKMTFVTSYFFLIQSWNLNYLYLFELLNLNIFWVRSFLNKCFIVWKHFLKHNLVVYYIFISIHFCHKVVYVRNSFQVWDICLFELSFWNFCLNESSVKDWVRILICFVYFYFHIKHVYYFYKVSFFHSDVQNQKNSLQSYTRLTSKFLIKVRHLSNPVFNLYKLSIKYGHWYQQSGSLANH